MRLLFCSDPLEPRQPEEAYAREVEAADRLAIPWSLIDHEALVREGDPGRAVRRVRGCGGGFALYRGWMIPVDDYAALRAALLAKGVCLLTDPEGYRRAHHLPGWYSAIEPHTPRSAWIRTGVDVDMAQVHGLLGPFGERALVLKDFVKSCKHAWSEACFIPRASDRSAVERVVRRFLELQGPELAEGLVFREYVPLEPAGTHPRSGAPLFVERRTFVLDGEPLFDCRHGDTTSDAPGGGPPLQFVHELARRVPCRFISLDLARRVNGEWIAIEVGDGQVSGLADDADRFAFLSAIRARWPAE